MKFLHVTCVSDTGIESPAIIGVDQIAMISPCPDGAHGCHVYFAFGIMSLKETMAEITRCLPGEAMEVPKGLTQ